MIETKDNYTLSSSQPKVARVEITVTGIVQGVGFRPFVYRYAKSERLSGFVLNNGQGVTIEVQGQQNDIDSFIERFHNSPPPLARIDTLSSKQIAIDDNCEDFIIVASDGNSNAVVAVSPDKSCCSSCLDEINDPDNRHYRYPFTNCTNCGPRYTLINALPYDRKHTSMASFDMCETCKSSYLDPMDRRYHAQPVSCPQCGPQLSLLTRDGASIAQADRALSATVQRLLQGEIVAIKGLGGFHLVCDATNHGAVERLRERKRRPAKPLAVMVSNLEMAKSIVTGSQFEWEQLTSIERPITIMTKCRSSTPGLSPAIAPGIDKLGVFLPYTPLHSLLLKELNIPIVATSANRSGEPIICDADEIVAQLGDVVDSILDHNRPIINACDDSVIQCVGDEVQVLRLARGFAPLSIHNPTASASHRLAVGAQQKNSIAFGFADKMVLSPHIGDLFSLEAESYFEHTLATFKRLYQFSPNVVISDKHPDYAPSKWAQQFTEQNEEAKHLEIQHHHAHILSVMAVNQVKEKVLGFSFDGTGLGDDQSLWGGEALIADVDGFQRVCHIKPFKLIGGEQAIRDPKRLLLAILFQQYSPQEINALSLPILNRTEPRLIENLHRLWQAGSNCIETSSVGRIFDAVAVLLGLIEKTQFEGQAGMLLEAAANHADTSIDSKMAGEFNFSLPVIDGMWDLNTLFSQLVASVTQEPLTQQRIGAIARGFMISLTDAITDLAKQHRSLPVVLCGGVFQNRYLSEQTIARLNELGHERLTSHQVPINDGGIALGQLWYGLHHN
ncbi:carbamoyltransferase HypF [uncultured Shewanella sp.]|uniref:carbamoyltransferase HypF n=1 Tax=Shewanella atlantica TaxID=271099 RepID=UPI0026261214|nr:carbamoyltransferase HypF [uncultured Shewanella sp.]